MTNLLMVFLGGGAGTVLRYLISLFFTKGNLITFPWATFTANLISCILMVLILRSGKIFPLDESMRLFLMVGFLGGLSTFSTFSYETSLLMKEGHHMMAFSNVGLSVSVCVYCLFKLT